MENMSSVRGPFDQSAYHHADIKTRFYRYFQDEVTGMHALLFRIYLAVNLVLELQEQVNQLENNILAGGERQEAIDHCLAGISRLTNEVTDVASSIPAYDQRTYAQVRETSVLSPSDNLTLETGHQSPQGKSGCGANEIRSKE
jgi:tubulin-specific chaperone C